MGSLAVGRNFFQRRGEGHPIPSGIPLEASTVAINVSEYHDLIRWSSEYRNLRNSLLENGLSAAAVDVLAAGNPYDDDSRATLGNIKDWADEELPSHQALFNGPGPIGQLPPNLLRLKNANNGSSNGGPRTTNSVPTTTSTGFHGSTYGDATSPVALDFLDYTDSRPANAATQKPSARQDHTLAFCNLPDGVTLKDIISVIKGGRVIEIYLRRQEHKAVVTFMEGAAEFLAYAKRHDVYIGSKRIDVSWSDRQFVVAQHLGVKLAHGATRNIIVRGAADKVDDTDIREHLDHIHNLIVIAIMWLGSDVVISTNSVNNAMFARTCMKSRGIYKGLAIEWYPDECEVPLPKPTAHRVRNPQVSPQVKKASVVNRFNLLDLEDRTDSDFVSTSEDELESQSSRIAMSPRSQATTTTMVY